MPISRENRTMRIRESSERVDVKDTLWTMTSLELGLAHWHTVRY